jgi:hypothetical protein
VFSGAAAAYRIVRMTTRSFAPLASLLIALSVHAAEAPKPKYAVGTVPLRSSHEYLRKAPAPDYWALSPYYVHQQDGRSCSVASVATLVNAARSHQELSSSDELVTQKTLLEKAKLDSWSKGVGDGGHGVTLDQLGEIVRRSLEAYGIKPVSVEVRHEDKSGPEALAELRRVLAENEKSDADFVVANVLQGTLTGDPEGGGHIAPIGAYDAKADRVLVLDPDRQWYEPYWVKTETLLAAMSTRDSESSRSRGYVRVKLR